MENSKNRPLIGITGGIGAGKSVVCKIFATLGIPVFNADEEAKYLVNNSASIKIKIIDLMGIESFVEGKYNKKFVAQKVFSNAELLAKLNAIIHPEVRKSAQNWAATQIEAPYLLYEAALMNKAGEGNNIDKVIVVAAPIILRIERIKARDNRTEAEIKAIIDKQISEEFRIKMADFIIENDEKHSLIEQVLKIDLELRNFQ